MGPLVIIGHHWKLVRSVWIVSYNSRSGHGATRGLELCWEERMSHIENAIEETSVAHPPFSFHGRIAWDRTVVCPVVGRRIQKRVYWKTHSMLKHWKVCATVKGKTHEYRFWPHTVWDIRVMALWGHNKADFSLSTTTSLIAYIDALKSSLEQHRESDREQRNRQQYNHLYNHRRAPFNTSVHLLEIVTALP